MTYHNYDEGGPEKPDCDTVTKNEEDEETFMIPAVFGFGAFTLVFERFFFRSFVLLVTQRPQLALVGFFTTGFFVPGSGEQVRRVRKRNKRRPVADQQRKRNDGGP